MALYLANDNSYIFIGVHGKLIDADELKSIMEKVISETDLIAIKMMAEYVIKLLDETPAVIPSNREWKKHEEILYRTYSDNIHCRSISNITNGSKLR